MNFRRKRSLSSGSIYKSSASSVPVFVHTPYNSNSALGDGAGRRAPDRSGAGGRPRRAGGRVPARKGARRGSTVPRLVPGRVSPGQPRFRPGGGRSETASVNARPSSLLLRPGRTPPAGDAEPAWRAHQLSGEWRSGRGRRAPHKERGERRGEKGRQFRDGYSRPRPPVPPVRGRGDNAAELTCRRPRSPGPCWTVPGSPSPLLARRPPPGRGAPPRFRGRRRKSVPAAEPGNLRAGKSLRSLRGAAWRGPRPWRPRSRPAGDFLGSSSARAAARTTGTAGRPESARGLCAPGLRPWRVAIEEGQERKTMLEEISSSGHRPVLCMFSTEGSRDYLCFLP
ncbi:translation initiation factor IF-2 [Myotis daubentonii]|uniref:translation initiation factor IF-2 n=1 Tax=Myotis daubentonii TaxID=98922 RepID=UPI0028730639|nr:translation initiation factor IF-2 [Myotis daubentonii]